MLRIIPIDARLTKREDPPYDKNGRVTPVTGINPTTTDKFIIVWNINWKVIPKDKYFENKSVVFKDIFILLDNNIKNKLTTITEPITPNSSEIIENIKSVWGSGR